MTTHTQQLAIRQATSTDISAIYDLYKCVARTEGGLARVEDEITVAYVDVFCTKSAQSGIQLVAIDSADENKVIGELHCYKLEPKVFSHVLSELTVAVDTAYQGRGIGKRLFRSLFEYVAQHQPEVRRIELVARESNQRAISMYQSLGFRIEGRLEGRIHNGNGAYEADIMMGKILI